MHKLIGHALLSLSLAGMGNAVFAAEQGSDAPSALVNTQPAPVLKNLAAFPIGVAVSAGDERRSLFRKTDQQALINQQFNSLVAGNIMKMRYLHPAEDLFTFDDADALANYAKEHGMILHGHALVWHPDYQVPAWMKNYHGDWDAMLKNHVGQIARHFAGRVASWDVANEVIDENVPAAYRPSLFYQKMGKSYIEKAFIAAHAADPAADLYYNDFNTESVQSKLDFMLGMIDDFKARQIPIHGIGFQMHVDVDYPSIAQIRKSFRAVADRGLKVRISELDVAVNKHKNLKSLTPAVAMAQKARYKEIVTAYLEEVPAAQRGGITVWGLVDGESWLSGFHKRAEWPLLFKDDYTTKPAFDGVVEALTGQ
ncbi:endo-1,4-beta-xylanase [Undibacterium sp. Ji49W]|uniref:endo-1,4-beta-xylanase n=1 Tax=Undibacterium sp. Ji49W TaxID=3413040 RepID=UPI003BEFB605